MIPATQETFVTSVLDLANATIKLLDRSASLWKARAEAAETRTQELEAQIKREDDLWVLLSNKEMVQLRFVRRKLSIVNEGAQP